MFPRLSIKIQSWHNNLNNHMQQWKKKWSFLLYLFPEFLHPLDDEYELGDEITQLLMLSGNALVYTESKCKAP